VRRIAKFITGKEWALFVSILTAAVAELPALTELVQGEVEREDWTPTGLIILLAGFVIRSNVFRAHTYEKDVAEAYDVGRKTGTALALQGDGSHPLRRAVAQPQAAVQPVVPDPSPNDLVAAYEAARRGEGPIPEEPDQVG
jgi:hypothetical protein